MTVPEKSKILIIVLSGNYSTGLGLVRSLGQAGYTVDLISAVKRKGSSGIVSSSKYVRKSEEILLTSDPQIDQEKIIKSIYDHTGIDNHDDEFVTKILIPADDGMSYILDRNKAVFGKDFVLAGRISEGRESLEHLMNKAVQGKYASLYGLKHPEEWIIDLRQDGGIPEEIIFPCFVKPLKSIEGSKTEMSRADDLSELADLIEIMRRDGADRSCLVQRFLDIDKEYDVGGVCINDDVLIPGVIEKIRVAQYEKGVTLSGKMVSSDVLGDELDKVRDLMRSFHYVGLFDLEFIVSNGVVYLNEINFRAGGPNYAYTLNGCNLPGLLVDSLISKDTDAGAESEPLNIESPGRTFVYEKVAWEEYIQGYMTRRELDSVISGADNGLLINDDDPAPGKIFNRKIRLSFLKHRILGH